METDAPVEDNPETRRRVIVESPFHGATPKLIRRNHAYAIAALRDCIDRGEAPLTSHMLYTEYVEALNANTPHARALVVRVGYAWWEAADAIIFYLDYGLSPGMAAARYAASNRDFRIEERYLDKNRNQEPCPY